MGGWRAVLMRAVQAWEKSGAWERRREGHGRACAAGTSLLRAASQNASSNVSNVRPTSNVRRFACFDFEDAAPVLRERLETRGTGDRDIVVSRISCHLMY
eukprot:scaffold15398_cov97-Isochrysis_galbana.AAC.5